MTWKGIENFLKKHKCNKVCRMLGLTNVKAHLDRSHGCTLESVHSQMDIQIPSLSERRGSPLTISAPSLKRPNSPTACSHKESPTPNGWGTYPTSGNNFFSSACSSPIVGTLLFLFLFGIFQDMVCDTNLCEDTQRCGGQHLLDSQ